MRRAAVALLAVAASVSGCDTEARGERVLSFCRERASVGVNLENVDVVEVSADHDAFGKYGQQASCATAGRLEP